MPAALTTDLRILTEALDPPRAELRAQLHELISTIRMTTSSYLGLAVIVVNGGTPFTIVAMDRSTDTDTDTGAVRSSALVPLATLCDVEAGSSIIFYAAGLEAFVEFAREVSTTLDLHHHLIELDGHLVPPVQPDAISDVAAESQRNQAIGVLIDRGFPPTAAHEELHRLADEAAIRPEAAAMEIIRDTATAPPASS